MININYTIRRPSANNLTEQVWDFRLIELSNRFELRLVGYSEMDRPTTRHKFRVMDNKIYTTYDRRNSRMMVADVPLPDDVKVEVYEKFMDEMNRVKIVKEW